jgi:superfamily I DNA and/or RNA helicase
MSDFRANLVILDECSQMTEPTSMLPILRFGAERLLLVGDPLQLPPTISTPCEKGVSGLDFTFFERMAETHIMPILLRTQYRCHPSIGSLSNDLFYEGSLTHSSQTSQLTSVIPQLPHVVFVDSLGSETNAKLSFINAQEAESIVNLVLLLIEKGVSCKEMGIIALCEMLLFKK